ncbi:MAG: type II secretion system GspH family protein [Saccharofermentans sp.]|nr:type II secretion system GspH family protein [Saccharofermentans sp.]
MRVRRLQSNIFLRDRKPSRRGFTLVELIVVLTIIAILAAVGVVGLVGYINKSHYDENSRNAVTVYQAAQNAIAAKTAGGTIDDWTQSVMQNVTHNDFTTSELGSITEVNDSYHKMIVLTYNPRAPRSEGTEDQALYDLLNPYFYDPSLFSATMSVEFDVSVTRDSDGDNYYTARVISAYYSKQNTGNSGWDSKCLGDNSNAPLPQIEPFSYRNTKSFVGYFDGSEVSITGPVAIPADQFENNYIFSLRNGETLDVCWSFFDNPQHDAQLTVTLQNEEDSSVAPVILTIDEKALLYDPSRTETLNSPLAVNYPGNSLLPDNNILSSSYYDYELIEKGGILYWFNKTSVEGLASVKVNGVPYVFPITITKVEHDYRNGMPSDGYTMYSLSIDCMMTRKDYDSYPYGNVNHNKLFTSDRLFGQTPQNISAFIEGSYSGKSIDGNYADRAVNDPVYLSDIRFENGYTRYCYSDTAAVGALDDSDKAVVNTMFGDLLYTDANGMLINGTSFGGSANVATITAYRHLSNIRMIPGNVNADFKIVRDLDWFTPEASTYDSPVSQVKVYASYASLANRNNAGYNGFRYHSPVEDRSLKVVSFPSIKELRSGLSLSSVSFSNGDMTEYFSINQVQMRIASFDTSATQFGLICKNSGLIYNLFTDNLNLVIVSVNDGSPSDMSGGNSNTSSISPDSAISITFNGSRPTGFDGKDNIAIGGLIGFNAGVVGLQNESALYGSNTVCMSNPIVMLSNYWKIYKPNKNNSCVGGMIGINQGTLYGRIKTDGSFAVLSSDKVGGIIGRNNNSSIGAMLVVDGNSTGTGVFTLPDEMTFNNGQPLACVVASGYVAGGALAHSEISMSFTNPDVNANDGIYDIDVTIPENGVVTSVLGYKEESVGGAIGMLKNCTGDSLDIRVSNSGNIVSAKTNEMYYVGGAIGKEDSCYVSNVRIDIYNGPTGRIGYVNDTSGPSSAGGAYGILLCNSNATRNFDINLDDEGVIIARGDDNNGSGGVAGVINSNQRLTFNINAVIHSSAKIIATSKNAGGVFGCTKGNNNNPINATINITLADNAVITGAERVGGSVGYNNRTISYNIDSSIEGNAAVIGTGNAKFIGGVIGYNHNPLSGSITSNISSPISVSGNVDIGGMIGHNENTIDSGDYTVNISGSGVETAIISGVKNVGGVIGYNNNNIAFGTDFSVTINNALISGTEDKIGGVIGCSFKSFNSNTNVTISNSHVKGNCDVGGSIGYSNSGKLWEDGGYVNIDITNSSIFGSYNIGGVIGHNNCEIKGDIAADITGCNITGDHEIGGIIGWCEYDMLSGKILTANISNATISGTGDYVGGILGKNSRNFNAITTTTLTNVTINGCNYVGGGIGYTNNGAIFDGGSFNIVLTEDTSVTGSGDCVGGGIGCNNSTIKGSVSVELDSVPIVGQNCTAGGIGRCDYDINSGVTLGVNCVDSTISGAESVAAAIGRNNRYINGIVDLTVSGSSITGTNYVAGIVGYNDGGAAAAAQLNMSFTDTYVASSSNYAAGAIGYNNKEISSSINATITTTASGESVIGGSNYVAGAIGFNNSNQIKGKVTVGISGNSIVTGSEYVSGGIGSTLGSLSYNTSGQYALNVTIDSSNAIQGTRYLGGAIGSVGGPNNAPTVNSINLTLNTSCPVIQTTSLAVNQDACIGSTVGQLLRGTVSNINVTGSGASVNPSTANSALPSRVYSNAILISGSGRYIGGVIGRSGSESNVAASRIATVSVSDINLCVVSANGSDFIGGYIGGSYGRIGGTGTNDRITYDVTGVKVVYSNAERVGGFCGAQYGNNTTSANLYSVINITYDNAIVSGRAQVGGVYGVISGSMYNGDIRVNLTNGTRIGDFDGSLTANGDIDVNSLSNCICIDVGGVIGYISATSGSNFRDGLIAVEFDATSKIFAGGRSDSTTVDLNNAGVGGVFGRIGTSGGGILPQIGVNSRQDNVSRHISVISATATPVICSASSNLGGVVGNMYSGQLRYAYSTAAIVNCTQTTGSGRTGGVVGWVNEGIVENCYCSGHTVGGRFVPGQDNIIGRDNVGGLVGRAGGSVNINQCYSTASVRGDEWVGGFAGYIEASQAEIIMILPPSGPNRFHTNYCVGRVTGSNDNSTGVFAGGVDTRYSIWNNAAAYRNKVLRNMQELNPDMRRIGNISEGFSIDGIIALQDQCVMWCDAGVVNPNNTNSREEQPNCINTHGDTYNAFPFDPYLNSGNLNPNGHLYYPYRCFTGYISGNNAGNHIGDWPMPPGNKPLTEVGTIIDIPETVTYTGDAIEFSPEELRVYNQGELVYGVDYLVTYQSNIDVGTATIQIFGIGDYYSGNTSITRTFNIVPANIDTVEFTRVFAESGDVNLEAVYTGEEIRPSVNITYGDITLVEGPDYTLEYFNNVNVTNEAYVSITGTGNYTGTHALYFTILPKDISEGQIDVSPDDSNTVTVTVDGILLTEGTDYTLATDNVDGSTVYTVEGKGNYTGTVSLTVEPPEPEETEATTSEPTDTLPADTSESSEETGGSQDDNTGGSGGETSDNEPTQPESNPGDEQESSETSESSDDTSQDETEI